MTIASMDPIPDHNRLQVTPRRLCRGLAHHLRVPTTIYTLLFLSALLLCASIAVYGLQTSFLGGQKNANTCAWYTVETGDTLTTIASLYHTTISTLVHANAIRDTNLIFVRQRLCIPTHRLRYASAGITANGTVRWYDYNALSWSYRSQVHDLLHQVAVLHHLPPRLLLAIAWQESGWRQHVIAWDGGIGVMQLMPYTAMSINAGIGQQLDPYALWDNLNLGATYLRWLWQAFHGNLPQVISAYNEGGWAVLHRGIFNWQYVNSVLALMRSLR